MAQRKKPPRPSARAKPTAARLVAIDGLATAIFVFGAAAISHLAKHAAPLLGLSAPGAGLALMLALLIVMGPACEAMGGAIFNPANNLALLYAQGQGSLWQHTGRSVGQAIGGVAGVLLARALLPPGWTDNLAAMAEGLRPSVGLLEGAACEFVLGSLLAFVVLWAGQLRSSLLKLWIPLAATVVAVKAGEGLTGPSLNPVFTFAFHFVYLKQDFWEHVVVYWVAPLAAGLFGGWAFRGWQQWAAERTAAQPRSRQRRAKAD
ncbi:hypothetical protein ABPG77_002818 [Micractinium sp. CCAP 211/92]